MSARNIFRNTLIILSTLAAAYLLVVSLRVLVLLFITIIIAASVHPIVRQISKWGVPQGVAVLLVYGALAVSVLVLLLLVLPPVFSQLAGYFEGDGKLADRIIYLQRWAERTISDIANDEVTFGSTEETKSMVNEIVEQIRAFIPGLVTNLGSMLGEAVLVFVMGIYWLTARESLLGLLVWLIPDRYSTRTERILEEMHQSIGAYIRGIMFVAWFVGAANFIVLALFNIDNALTLAFIVGISTLLPVIGGLVGGGLATLLAALMSPLQAVVVFITFLVIQQIEAHYLSPRVMARSVKLDPLLVIVAMMIGWTVAGVVGAVIAVPLVGMAAILGRHVVVSGEAPLEETE